MLNSADERLAARLPEGVLRDVAPAYLDEPRDRWKGTAGLVAAPRDADEVAAVVRACADARVPIVPRGGGTGLVAGQVLPDGALPLILSMERMTAIRAIHPDENVVIAEAGVTLQSLRDAAADVGRLFPLSLAAQGTAQIGGCLAVNAGGVNVLRYGNTRALCLGIEAVMPDGSVIRSLPRLRKDNTGYSIRDLLIGAEGTLGIITAASLVMEAIPASTGTALMAVEGPEAALELLSRAQARMAGCVSAFELISGQGMRFLAETMPQVRLPFAEPPEWMVLIDVGLPEGLEAASALENLFIEAAEAGLVDDGLIAQSEQQAADFWNVRESIPEANRKIGAVASHDISLPLSEVAGFIEEAGAQLADRNVRVNCFGHLGDGNLHYNLFPAEGRSRADYDDQRAGLSRLVHELAVARGGSFSAEHGVGRLKVGDLERWGDPARLAAMRAIKSALDPLGIMNPGAVLRA
ncbi:FAD-binding oxidoreductase (plasmid) [Paracoccus sp. TK19116]|uniref:FAD-binding oxidoreductase n=1 Tax=Paracoccus albicereus TaxID=2922394 RepID=A0ABT1MKW0_9RHOB|nr:FAD-binding oxidoreductase [Paracoccus albicereus]MCQ0968932.1 FAD-binding oxidoreductase [Paracoccus albicereus]